MNLAVVALDLIRKVSQGLADELQRLVTWINAWAAKEHHGDGTHAAITVTGFTWNNTTQTTVGAAGGATALPATPTGYWTVTIDGVEYVSPFYAKS